MNSARFRSDRVRLRALEPTDADALHAYLNDPALLGRCELPWAVPDIAPLSRRQVVEVLDAWGNQKKAFTLGIELAHTGELIGHAGCNWNWDAHCPTVSIAVAPAHQRTGIGSEVLRLLLTHLFEDTPAHNVHGFVAGWNGPGIAFARRLGFTESGRIPRSGIRGGAWFDSVLLDILKPEWLAEKGGSHGS